MPTVIAVLGAGLVHQKSKSPTSLWAGRETRRRAAAGTILSKNHNNAPLILSGGNADPQGVSEAEAMAGYLKESPWNIEGKNMYLETKSEETAGNVRGIVKILEAEGLQSAKLFVVAGKRHACRVERYFRAYGLCVEVMTASKILPEVRTSDAIPICDDSVLMKDWLKEYILLALQYLDKKGVIPSHIRAMQKSRHHE